MAKAFIPTTEQVRSAYFREQEAAEAEAARDMETRIMLGRDEALVIARKVAERNAALLERLMLND